MTSHPPTAMAGSPEGVALFNALALAIDRDDAAGCRELIDAGANPLGGGGRLLYRATQLGRIEPLRTLLRAAGGAASAYLQPLLTTAIVFAPEGIDILVDAGASPEAHDGMFGTPLLYAADRCSAHAWRILRRRGARPDLPAARRVLTLVAEGRLAPELLSELLAAPLSLAPGDRQELVRAINARRAPYLQQLRSALAVQVQATAVAAPSPEMAPP